MTRPDGRPKTAAFRRFACFDDAHPGRKGLYRLCIASTARSGVPDIPLIRSLSLLASLSSLLRKTCTSSFAKDHHHPKRSQHDDHSAHLRFFPRFLPGRLRRLWLAVRQRLLHWSGGHQLVHSRIQHYLGLAGGEQAPNWQPCSLAWHGNERRRPHPSSGYFSRRWQVRRGSTSGMRLIRVLICLPQCWLPCRGWEVVYCC